VPDYIRTDNTRIQQILMNYLGNAIKFTFIGTIKVRVSFKKDRALSNSGLLEIEVKDSGWGISERDQRKLLLPLRSSALTKL